MSPRGHSPLDDGPGLFDLPEGGPRERTPPLAEPRRAERVRDDPAREQPPRAERERDDPEREVAAPTRRRASAEPRVLGVVELTEEIHASLMALGRVSVEGEVGGLSRPGSGHVFFDLKEGARAKIACKLWKSQVARALPFELLEGQQVVLHGRLDVWAPRGAYSLIVERVEQRGIGALLAQLEELKRELRARGWLDRKRPLPTLPRTIGVATSRDGAALHDFLRTRSMRWPLYPVRLAHCAVQGAGAAHDIADAIRRLDQSGVAVIVVIRGGGSLEDLWAFNERVVAEAIFASRAPVVCGVGHQSDVTLADLVADHRAHTPTDAAQTVIPERRAYVERLERAGSYLVEAVEAHVAERARRLERAARSRVLRGPGWILGERARALEAAARRLISAGRTAIERRGARRELLLHRLERQGPRARLERARLRVARGAERLVAHTRRRLESAAGKLSLCARSLEATSPLAVLGRGYSIARRRGEQRLLRDAAEVAPGDELETRLARGAIVSRVVEVRPAAAPNEGA